MDSIYTKSVLCKISISQFNPRRSDSKITKEVLEQRNASKEAGGWFKNLIDPKAIDPITAKGMQARAKHYELTLPWADEGYRILPITLYERFRKEIHKSKSEFENEVERLLNEDNWTS